MITEHTRQKLKDNYARRVARGENFGFKKGHELLRKPPTKKEIEKRVATFKANFIHKPYPICIDCSAPLKERRSERCHSCAAKERTRIQKENGTYKTVKGKTWKIDMTPERKARRALLTGEASPSWKGGISKRNGRFVRNRGQKYNYRILAEEYLGRPLLRREVIHHINEDPTDDRIDNFYLFRNNVAHMKWHLYIRRNGLDGSILKSNLELYSLNN